MPGRIGSGVPRPLQMLALHHVAISLHPDKTGVLEFGALNRVESKW